MLIGICGGSGSGKTWVSNNIIDICNGGDDNKLNGKIYEKIYEKIPEKLKNILKNVKKEKVFTLSTDNFYIPLTKQEKNDEINFDDPKRINTDLLVETINNLVNGKISIIPNYDFETSNKIGENVVYDRFDLIIVEGLFVTYFEKVKEILDFKIFVDAPENIRYARRLDRDLKVRKAIDTEENLFKYWNKYVEPAYVKYVLPGKESADFKIENF